MSRAEKYALMQSQVLLWALAAAAVYFVATRLSIVFAGFIAATTIVMFGWILLRLRRNR